MFEFLSYPFQLLQNPFSLLSSTEKEVLTLKDPFYMKNFVSGQLGSNPGGLYKGADGILRYIKLYPNSSQAFCEHIANFVYNKLGLLAPKSTIFFVNDTVYYASEFIDDLEKLSSSTITKKLSEKVVKGLVADMILSNWDVIGLTFDNISLLNGSIIRLDNGGSLLFRAQGDRKIRSQLLSLPEWEFFFQNNPSYSRLLSMLDYQYPSNFPISSYKSQLEQLKKLLQPHNNSWQDFLISNLPIVSKMNKADFRLVSVMLDKRMNLLQQRIISYNKELLIQSRLLSILTPQITYLNNLSDFQKRAIVDYTESPAINKLLRNIDTLTRDFKLLKKNIDDVFKYIPPLEKSITVYRGIKFKSTLDFTADLNDFGFISTTYDKPIAFEFLDDYKCCLLEITLEPGTKVIPLESFSKYPEEKELLLPPGKFSLLRSINTTYFDKPITINKVKYIPEEKIESQDQFLKFIRLVSLEMNAHIFTRSRRHTTVSPKESLQEVDRAISIVKVPFVYQQDVKKYFSSIDLNSESNDDFYDGPADGFSP